MYGIIYKATAPDGRVYIGQTIQGLKKRKKCYKFRTMKKDRRTPMQVALLEFGFNSFIWEEIDIANNAEELNVKEKYYIAFYKSNDLKYGFNISEGGIGSKHTLETRRKISEANSGVRSKWYGRRHSEETLAKLRGDKNPGSVLSEAQVRLIKKMIIAGYNNIYLAKKYNVHKNRISDIRCGKTWGWLQ